MGFQEAVKTCLTKYFTLRGRASRSEFWWFFLFYNLATLVGFILVMMTLSPEGDGGTMWPMIVAFLFLLPPLIAVTVRRLHDKGLTGWIILISVVPFGSVALMIICALPGDIEENAHGPALPTQPAAQDYAKHTYTKSNIPNVKDRD